MGYKTWERDKTPYLVFTCSKCHQYIYVKTIQKSKKCLRCGRVHQVKLIKTKGEIVYGISEAVNCVKELQNTLGVSKFSAEGEFIATSKKEIKDRYPEATEGYDHLFFKLLQELSSKYREFPLYMIELRAQDYQIPLSELKILIKNSVKEQKLIPLKGKSRYSYKY